MKNKKINITSIRKVLFLSIILGSLANSSLANDRLFSYIYQSNVLNKGQKELEIWTTVHSGRFDFYREIKNRFEFEIGLGKNIQTAFYINTKQKSYFNVDLKTLVNESPSFSFSNEWKFKLSDPIADKIGSALYIEYGITPSKFEVELKIILDKQIGKYTHAFNLEIEPEWGKIEQNGELKDDSEVNFMFAYGISYNINKNWNLGLEVRNHNEWRAEVDWEHSALFAGPTVSYTADKFWVNFTILPQIAKLHHYDENYTNSLVLDEHEKLEMRLLFSFVF